MTKDVCSRGFSLKMKQNRKIVAIYSLKCGVSSSTRHLGKTKEILWFDKLIEIFMEFYLEIYDGRLASERQSFILKHFWAKL